MSRSTVRYASHRALINLEWIERHIAARPNTREVRERLLNEIEDLRNFIIKRSIGASFDHPQVTQQEQPALELAE
jgi:hypothetical protein